MSIESIQQNASLGAYLSASAGLSSAGTGENGLFSGMLQQELMEQAAQSTANQQSATAKNTTQKSSGNALLQTLLPLLLSGGLGSDSTGSMTAALLLALSSAQAGGSDGSMASMLGGGSSLGMLSGGLTGNTAASAASQAGFAAGTALVNAFSKVPSAFSGNNLTALRSYTGGSKVRSGSYGGTTLSSGAVVPTSASTPTTPAVTSSLQNRSPERYRAVIEQFQVDSAKRYMVNKRGNNDTYCNIFLWDVTSAMGAEIPHYTDWETGTPLSYENIDSAKQMNANRISDWLNSHGPKYGWYEVTPEQAQQLANEGRPAVTVWKNPTGGHGHVQVVSPSTSGAYDSSRGVAIAQAGRNLTDYTYITNVYSSRLKDVQYFAHA